MKKCDYDELYIIAWMLVNVLEWQQIPLSSEIGFACETTQSTSRI